MTLLRLRLEFHITFTSHAYHPPVAAGGDGEGDAVIKTNTAAKQTTTVGVRPLGLFQGPWETLASEFCGMKTS